jgi:hypothetical protein
MSLNSPGTLDCGTLLHSRRYPSTDLRLPPRTRTRDIFPLGSFSDRLLDDAYVAKRGHLIHKLKAKDSTQRWAYYFVLVWSSMEQAFLEALKSESSIDLEDYGRVIASCYGEMPKEEVQFLLQKKYGFSV